MEMQNLKRLEVVLLSVYAEILLYKILGLESHAVVQVIVRKLGQLVYVIMGLQMMILMPR